MPDAEGVVEWMENETEGGSTLRLVTGGVLLAAKYIPEILYRDEAG